MKKSLLITTFIYLFSVSSNAQTLDFKPFKVDMLVGIGASKDVINSLFSVEPKYNLINNFCLGLKWENAPMYSTKKDGTTLTFGPNGTINSIVLTGEFYAWHDIRLRPFVGAGSGLYFANFNVEKNSDVTSKLGFMIRGGLQIGHFRIVVENNFIPEDAYKLNYFTLKFGATFGGGWLRK